MIYVEHLKRALEGKPMRKQWETTTAIVSTKENDWQKKLDLALNQLGQEGWELVSVFRDMERVVAYLKREKRMM